jgi:hypothetical protein
MANTKLAQATPGTVVKTNYNGAPTNFVVLHQGKPSPIYDDSFNGGTIMRFESIPENYQWTTTGTNDYAASGVQAHIQEYVQYFDPGIQSNIKTVKIPYRPGAGSSATVNSGANGLECQMYLLAAIELGIAQTIAPVDGALLDYYLSGATPEANAKRVTNYNGSPMRYNTRSPYVNDSSTTSGILEVQTGGNFQTIHTGNNNGVLPAFVLDANALEIDETGTLVKASSGTGMFIPADKLEQGVEYYFRIYPRNHQNQFQTGIDGSQLHMVVQDGNEAVPDDSAPAEIIPSYTGNSQIFGDGTKGYMEMYDSGVLTFNTDVTVDMFLVGAGAGGSSYTSGSSDVYNAGGGGAGSGYTKTLNNISFSKGTEYAVTIGAGGTGGNRSGGASVTPGTAGGSTSVDTYSVNGGSPGGTNSSGGNGGSGGGSGGKEMGSQPGSNGGSNGSNGGQVTPTYPGGTGQGTTTHEFMDTQKRLFAGAGGGGGYRTTAAGKGGAGGGGDGGSSSAAAQAGQANTGGGGGGSGSSSGKGGNGGSGIAIIRWGDWSTSDTGSSSGGAN